MKSLAFFLLIAFAGAAYGQVDTRRPIIREVVKTPARCNGEATGKIEIKASGGRLPYSYSIDGGSAFQRELSFPNLKAGTYTVIVRDTFNVMSDSQKAEITEPSKLILSCSGNIQCGGNSGTVSVNVSGGVSPYAYSWNAGPQPSSPSQTGLPPGIYVVTVFDANQCSDTCSIILTQQQGSSTPTYKIGDSISCGYIFHVDLNADSMHPCSAHYLVCSFKDQSSNATWYSNQFTYTVTGATADILFDRANALRIDSFSRAANLCSQFTTDSCSGWYLPSKTELDSIYANLAAKKIGGFAQEGYWSSVEGAKRHSAWIVDFLNGREIQNDKSNKYHVRAICDVWIKNE